MFIEKFSGVESFFQTENLQCSYYLLVPSLAKYMYADIECKFDRLSDAINDWLISLQYFDMTEFKTKQTVAQAVSYLIEACYKRDVVASISHHLNREPLSEAIRKTANSILALMVGAQLYDLTNLKMGFGDPPLPKFGEFDFRVVWELDKPLNALFYAKANEKYETLFWIIHHIRNYKSSSNH